MDRGKRAFVTGVHGLQHIESLFASNLTDDNAVRAHTQAVDDQLPLAHGSFAFDVGRTRFQADDVFLFELKFCGVFNGDNTIGVGNVAREHVEKSGFAGTGSARDQDVQASLYHGREHLEHGLSEGVVLDHVAGGDGLASKTADGETRTVDGQRRYDGVNARAIRQTCVDHRRRFVHPAADPRYDALDDLHQVPTIFKG